MLYLCVPPGHSGISQEGRVEGGICVGGWGSCVSTLTLGCRGATVNVQLLRVEICT